MENNKLKMLRIVEIIYNIKPKTFVTIIKENREELFICKTVNGEIDLYNPQNDNIRWGMSVDNLDELRKGMLQDYLEGFYEDIKL
jgi:hypothetical protein